MSRCGLKPASSPSPCNRPPLPQLCELQSGVPMNLVWKSLGNGLGNAKLIYFDFFSFVFFFLFFLI